MKIEEQLMTEIDKLKSTSDGSKVKNISIQSFLTIRNSDFYKAKSKRKYRLPLTDKDLKELKKLRYGATSLKELNTSKTIDVLEKVKQTMRSVADLTIDGDTVKVKRK